MIRAAIVEDDSKSAEQIRNFIEKYSREKGKEIHIVTYGNGLNFLEDYKDGYDIVFMDIELPFMDGMEVARKLRAMDWDVCILFVTNMAQYAVNGYEVEALDFMVKPVEYFEFSLKLDRAVQKCEKKQDDIIVRTKESLFVLKASDIYYIEVVDHILVYHTKDKEIKERGTLREKEKQLQVYHFCRCNSCYLVNLAYVTSVDSKYATVNGEKLSISNSRRKPFMEALTQYIGGM